MKNTIITILKKELKRFFSDKRMAFSTVLMPGIMIFVLYNFMGDAINNMVTVDDNYVYQIESTNMPGDIKTMMDSAGIASKITDIDAGSAEKAKEKISNDESGLDLYLVFPENFESDVAHMTVLLEIRHHKWRFIIIQHLQNRRLFMECL